MTTPDHTSAPRLRLGISGCLLGQQVRYNGGHKHSSLCTEVLAPWVDFISFCPEQAAGFGTPRPAMHLTGPAHQPQLVQVRDASQNLRPQLEAGFQDALDSFASLDGFILMARSPSCGLFRIKLYNSAGELQREQTRGIFASALQARYPLLPVEEEGRLHNPQLFDHFMLRVQAYRHYRNQVLSAPAPARLTGFHARYKYLLMAHNPQHTRQMGRYLAQSHSLPLQQRCADYLQQLMHCLATPATRKNHSNALQHMLGYLRGHVSREARQLLVKSIEQFRHGHQPLHVPLNLLQHYAAQLDNSYLHQQHYFSPYPVQLHPVNQLKVL